MENKKFLLSTVLLAWTSLVAFAQQNNVAFQRRVLNAAFNTIENYSVWSSIPNDEEHYDFLTLFVNKESSVYNDLLGIKQGNSLTAEEYANTLLYNLGTKNIVIRNIKNEGISFDNGRTLIRLSFDKSISYVDSCDTYYSGSEFYEKDYHLTATLNYDSTKNECKIIGIDGIIDSPKKLGDKFFAFQRTNPRDDELRYNGELLKFNRHKQALLNGERDPQILRKSFSYSNSDMELRPQTNGCQVTMRYKMRRWRLRPYFAIGLGKAFSRDGDGVLSDSKSSGQSFGVDVGFNVLSKGLFSLGVYSGLGFSLSSMSLLYKNADYSFNSNADVDGDIYIRHYENLSLSQKMKFSELNIPLYLDLSINIVKSLSVYVDLGMRFDANIGHKVNETTGSAYAYGIYPQYDNLRLDHQWAFNGFGTHQFGSNELLSSDLIDVKGFTVSGMAGFGLRYNLPRVPLAIEAGMNIVMGLSKLIETANVSTPESATPVVYNTISGTESTEHVRNLTEMLNSVKRQQLRFSIGLIYKF